MELEKTEVVYYSAIAVMGCVGGLLRQWRDGRRSTLKRAVGGVLSGGLFSFGGVGIWLGSFPDGTTGPIYYMAVASFVGFYSTEVQDVCQATIKSILLGLLKRLGAEVEKD